MLRALSLKSPLMHELLCCDIELVQPSTLLWCTDKTTPMQILVSLWRIWLLLFSRTFLLFKMLSTMETTRLYIGCQLTFDIPQIVIQCPFHAISLFQLRKSMRHHYKLRTVWSFKFHGNASNRIISLLPLYIDFILYIIISWVSAYMLYAVNHEFMAR